jgi:hypothetical protein
MATAKSKTPALDAYVGRINAMRSIFLGQNSNIVDVPFPTDEATSREIIARLAQDLSPENLSCDGELSLQEIRIRYAHIMTCVLELEKILCRKIELAC